MEDKSISEILTVLNQMEAEDKAEDAQRRGRAKLKLVIEGFAQVRKEIPPLEQKKIALAQQIADLQGQYEAKRKSKHNEVERDIQVETQRLFSAKTKAEMADRKAKEIQTKLDSLEAGLKVELANWERRIVEKQEEFDKVKKSFEGFLKRQGLAATG